MPAEHDIPARETVLPKHSIFVVGRIRKGEQQLVFLDPASRPVFPGPWKIRAVLVD